MVKRLGFGFLAVVLIASSTTYIFKPPLAYAVGQVSSRKIVMSTSLTSATATYALTFTPVTTSQELIVEFCSNSPLVGDTCSFTAATVPTVASPVSNVGTASSVGTGSPVHTIKVVGLAMTAATPFTINFTSGITNPTTALSFYARILTYPSGAGGAVNYVPGNTSPATPTTGTYTDYGGVALATTNNLLVTAKVFETLTFCVFQTACGTQANLTLGDPVTQALSTSNAYVNSNAQYTLSSNAGGGVNVTMTGQTLCRATPQTFVNCPIGASVNTIRAIGATPVVRSPGTEQFGMCVDVVGSSLTAGSDYTDSINNCNSGLATGAYAGTSKFGFDDSAGANGSNSASGSQVMSSTGSVANTTNTFSLVADISSTTDAGYYQSSLNMVATGTF